ncbi:MAG TPA: TMEM175 family protein [Vicinamibacterales bacterium]|nr:TMEM175 family protein [Vicinamibacterales bacterium]
MNKSRLEAFSDGVIAIIITIMVLELHIPESADWHALLELLPNFSSYILSFIYLAIYWNNHHYMIHAATRVTAGVLWANLHLLFWLSLIPFATGWMGRHHLEAVPSATYGAVLFMAGFAYWILQQQVMRAAGPHSRIAQAIGRDAKGLISVALYAAAIAFAFVNQWVSDAVYAGVAMIWLVPDRRLKPS